MLSLLFYCIILTVVSTISDMLLVTTICWSWAMQATSPLHCSDYWLVGERPAVESEWERRRGPVASYDQYHRLRDDECSAGVDCVLWCYWHCRVRIIIKQSPLHGHQLSIIDNYLLHYRGQHFGLISMIIITLFVVCTFCTEINEVHILSWLCEWWSFWRELFNYQLGWSNWIEMPRISVKSVGDWWIEAFKIKFWKPHSRADKLDQISRAIFRRVYTFTLLNALHQKRTPKEGGASG